MLLWAQPANLHLLQWHKLDQSTDDSPGLLFAHVHLLNIKAAGHQAAISSMVLALVLKSQGHKF